MEKTTLIGRPAIDAILPELVERGHVEPIECAFAPADEQDRKAETSGQDGTMFDERTATLE